MKSSTGRMEMSRHTDEEWIEICRKAPRCKECRSKEVCWREFGVKDDE